MRTRIMSTDASNHLALTRLLQLVSPSLPVGGYSYSQGIEWAVEAGWIDDQDSLRQWLQGLMQGNFLYLEIPILKRMIDAWRSLDLSALARLNDQLIASRETRELRQEEINRARALTDLLCSLRDDAAEFNAMLRQSQMAGFSFACERWGIDDRAAAQGLLASWLENGVLAGIKIIPLGQTAGQQIIFELGEEIPAIVDAALNLPDAEIGASSMALAIASANHETQYTRLFRS